MPISYIKVLENGCRLGVWRMDELLFEMLESYGPNEDELKLIQSRPSEKRQKEWLAARLLLREMRPGNVTIAYGVGGEPFLPGSGLFISISHSGPLVAVLVSSKGAVGVDIQQITARPLVKGMEYFLSVEEQHQLHDVGNLQNLHLYWSIKEAVFKGCPDVRDMKAMLSIVPFDVDVTGMASCVVTTDRRKMRVHYWFMEGYVLVAMF